MRIAKVTIPSLFHPETNMSREEGDVRGDATLNIPLWLVSLIKVSMPAIVVAVGMYFRVSSLEEANKKLTVEHALFDAKLTEKSDKILLLEQKTENMKALDALTQTNSSKALERIETELKAMQADVKEIRAKQLVMFNAVPSTTR